MPYRRDARFDFATFEHHHLEAVISVLLDDLEARRQLTLKPPLFRVPLGEANVKEKNDQSSRRKLARNYVAARRQARQ